MEATSIIRPTYSVVSQRIRDWFHGEILNHGWQESLDIASEIDAMISQMPEPLPESAVAWRRWNDFEKDTSRHDPGLYVAMDLCRYSEWAADVDLGLTTEPYEGVPRILISIGRLEER
jgi:hypothetical protein